MKKSILPLLAAASLLSVAVTSCKEDHQMQDPVLKLDKTTIEIPSEGGTFKIGYNLENPRQSESVHAKSECEWINSFSTEVLGEISFVADKNEADEAHTGMIFVTYPGADPVEVTVIQGEIEKETLEIVIDATDEVSVTASVYPSDASMSYIMMLTSKQRYDELGSDEANFEDDMKYYTEMATEQGMTLGEFLKQYILLRGDTEKERIDKLTPDTEYVVYAYGLTAEIVRTTDIFSKVVSTDAVTPSGCTFDFNIGIDGTSVSMEIIPSDKDARYYTSHISRSSLEELWELEIEEYAINDLSNELFYYQYMYGTSLEEAIEALTFKGDRTTEEVLQAEAGYYIYAFSVSDYGNPSSEIAYELFKTGSAEMSDNEIGVEVINAGIVSADIRITTTNSDSYGIKAIKASEIEGMDNKQIASYIMEVRNFEMNSGDARMVLKGLDTETEYVAAVFGFDLNAYAITTEVKTASFTTLSGSDADNASFSIEFENIKPNSFDMNLTAQPENALYLWGLVSEDMTADKIIEEINSDYESSLYWGDVADRGEYMRKNARSGSFGYTFSDLMEDTSYKVYAVGVSFDTGEFISDVFLSETVTTAKTPLADIDIKLTWDKYYNGDELAELDPENMGGALGYLILPVKVEISGNETAASYRYHIHTGNVSDTEAYSDGYIKDFLNSYGRSDQGADYAVIAEKEYTLVAYAATSDGKHSPVFREVIKLSYSGTSPAEEYLESQTPSGMISAKSSAPCSTFRLIKSNRKAEYSEGTPVIFPEGQKTVKSAKTTNSLRAK